MPLGGEGGAWLWPDTGTLQFIPRLLVIPEANNPLFSLANVKSLCLDSSLHDSFALLAPFLVHQQDLYALDSFSFFLQHFLHRILSRIHLAQNCQHWQQLSGISNRNLSLLYLQILKIEPGVFCMQSSTTLQLSFYFSVQPQNPLAAVWMMVKARYT